MLAVRLDPAGKILLDDHSAQPHVQQLPPVETVSKICPECHAPMLRKQARHGPGKGRFFLACNRYPACRYSEPCQ